MLETAGALLVPVAVAVRFPPICVKASVFEVRVICELEEVVALSEPRVKVLVPETKTRSPVLVTVTWPERVM